MTSPRQLPALLPGEFEIADDVNELLYRQATTPYWDPNSKQPSSNSFGPASVDHGKPSFSRSSKTTAQDSRDWHNSNGRAESHGVWACTVSEVAESQTRAIDDSAVEGAKGPGHCYVDYRGVDKKDERVIRSFLLAKALARGEISTT